MRLTQSAAAAETAAVQHRRRCPRPAAPLDAHPGPVWRWHFRVVWDPRLSVRVRANRSSKVRCFADARMASMPFSPRRTSMTWTIRPICSTRTRSCGIRPCSTRLRTWCALTQPLDLPRALSAVAVAPLCAQARDARQAPAHVLAEYRHTRAEGRYSARHPVPWIVRDGYVHGSSLWLSYERREHPRRHPGEAGAIVSAVRRAARARARHGEAAEDGVGRRGRRPCVWHYEAGHYLLW